MKNQHTEFHEIANLFPLIEGKEFSELVNGTSDSGHPELLDGQHRLLALIEANMELPFLVIVARQ